MSGRRVTLVELPLYPNTLPLASGYLQAYAQQDPEIAAAFRFTITSLPAATPFEAVADRVLAGHSDVYALSCYLWNMRAMRRLLDRVRAEQPDAYVILGGPQVMEHAATYVPADAERVVVCDGEGEESFAGFLRAVLAGGADFTAVPGVSFFAGGALVRTARPDRITSLDDIPSPFAAGVFDGAEYTFAVVETNRGCPFSCSYCYWGAATNDKVHRWTTQRVLDDLTWIGAHGIESVFIADANWGALPRDVELTRHLVQVRKQHGYPFMVSMQAAKNRPDRVTEITEILVDGGMLASQPVSLQTLSPGALEMVQRANIKERTYTDLQQLLRQKEISSYTELIWPLPGETLTSFRNGIERLCTAGADAIVIYPQLLLHNTPMYAQQEVLAIETVTVDDPVAEADVVVGTKWVPRADFDAGVWLSYAVTTLYNARATAVLAGHLERTGICSYGTVLDRAAQYLRTRTDNPICAFFADSVEHLRNYDLNNTGKVLHLTLHSHRNELDELLRDFLTGQGWLTTTAQQVAFELDLLGRPYVYREPVVPPAIELRHVRIAGRDRYRLLLDVPEVALELLDLPAAGPGARLRLDHSGRHKMPHPRHRSLEHNAAYCQAMMNRLRDIAPAWAAVPAGDTAGVPGAA